ncbi:MAG: GxxExxY protein [Bacteroidota bacterium]
MCYGKIIIELKALDRLSGKEEAQILNHLKATGLRVGLLINFGSVGKLEWKRFETSEKSPLAKPPRRKNLIFESFCDFASLREPYF